MKKRSILGFVCLLFCMMAMTLICFPGNASAKEIKSVRQAIKLAKKEVKGATVMEADTDRKKGELIYEIELQKGAKEYDLVYRARDARLISYGYEVQSFYRKRGNGKIIGINKCRKLAKKQVPGGKIVSVVRKYDDGISIYKVKMKKGRKKYEMKLHAVSGKILEYEWDLVIKKNKPANDNYDEGDNSWDQSSRIDLDTAKKIAVADAGVTFSEATFIEAKLDFDDGVAVYEIEFYTSTHEYEYEINASTGKICSSKKESLR